MSEIDMDKQLRKAKQLHDDLLRADKAEEAEYVLALGIIMLTDAKSGHPRPWKDYLPRYHEEFGL